MKEQPNQSPSPEYNRGFSDGWDRGHAHSAPQPPQQGEPVAWMDEIIEDLHALYDGEMITENDSGDALIRLDEAVATVQDAKERRLAPQPPQQGEPAQPTRSEKMRDAGITRRPARSWPLDGNEPAQQNPAPGYCKHCKEYTIEAPLPAQQPLSDERAKFESWAGPITALAKENGTYVEVMTSLAWEAWQARASKGTK